MAEVTGVPVMFAPKPGDDVGIPGRRIAGRKTAEAGHPIPPAHKNVLTAIAAMGRTARYDHVLGHVGFTPGNPGTHQRMEGDMDVGAGWVLGGRACLEDVGDGVFAAVLSAADGAATGSEGLGRREFALSSKTYEPGGPECLPGAA